MQKKCVPSEARTNWNQSRNSTTPMSTTSGSTTMSRSAMSRSSRSRSAEHQAPEHLTPTFCTTSRCIEPQSTWPLLYHAPEHHSPPLILRHDAPPRTHIEVDAQAKHEEGNEDHQDEQDEAREEQRDRGGGALLRGPLRPRRAQRVQRSAFEPVAHAWGPCCPQKVPLRIDLSALTMPGR